MSQILIVDDEPTILAAFEDLLKGEGYEVALASNAPEALKIMARQAPDLLVMDICMPGIDGLEAFRQLRGSYPRLPVIIMTAQGTMDSAIEATKLGAFDYQLKPFEPEVMLGAIERALEAVRIAQRHVELDPAAGQTAHDAIVGHSGQMQELYKAIGRVAATDATVLVRGESGVGKELVARALYQHSLRSRAPLQIVNCVAIPETLLESELFGYERGAFTGATSRRIGKFEQAHGGTIFLDEIGDIPLGVQSKLLRVLQERSFERIGGNETIRVDVRVLAATNRDLQRAVREGAFREDLYYRLNVVEIRIPPLRERLEDLPRLLDYFLTRFAAELHVDKPVLAPDAMHVLRSHPWLGNVRELEHCLYRTMIFTRGYPIQAADLLEVLKPADAASAAQVPDEQALRRLVGQRLDAGGGNAYEQFLTLVDRLLVEEALRRTGNNQTLAARLLGIPRPTLHAKLRKHRLTLHMDAGCPSADTMSES